MSAPSSRTLLLALAAVLAACHPASTPHNAELDELKAADQAARSTNPPDFSGDAARRQRVLEMLAAGEVRTGLDHCSAALVLQHGNTPEDYLLAHELAVGALAQGHLDCRWLAVATEDRYLRSIGRKQRFGTQYRCPREERRCELAEVEPGVTDFLRQVMAAPALAEAKRREQDLTADLFPPLVSGSAAAAAAAAPTGR